MRRSFLRRPSLYIVLAAVLSTGACGMIMHTIGHDRVPVPAESEFGLGPRASATGALRATIETPAPLRTGKLQVVRVHLVDRDGAPVRDANVTIDGGMPQHGHGLPTKPRVSGGADGTYVVSGLRFNMGGWWVLKVAVAGNDSVTFNIRL